MPRPEIQILVCLNQRASDAGRPSCAGRGSEAVYHRFKDRVRELGLRNRVLITRTGCLKHCSRGITVVIWPYNLWYGSVRPEDVDEILQRSVLGGGAEIERLVMPEGPWE